MNPRLGALLWTLTMSPSANVLLRLYNKRGYAAHPGSYLSIGRTTESREILMSSS